MAWVKIRWNGAASHGTWYWEWIETSSPEKTKAEVSAIMKERIHEQSWMMGRASADWEIENPPQDVIEKEIERLRASIKYKQGLILQFQHQMGVS